MTVREADRIETVVMAEMYEDIVDLVGQLTGWDEYDRLYVRVFGVDSAGEG